MSEQLSKLFPDVQQQINEPDVGAHPKIELDDLSNILSKIDRGQLPPQLEFFTGAKNEKFETKAKLIGLSTDSSEFVDFIQTGIYEQILKNNKLKIHIESGNIYFDNTDTNESIYGFLQAQEDETKKFIDFEFIYSDTYQNYFDEYLLKFNLKNDDKLDVLANKNSKFLFYHFNDYLTRINVLTKPVRHTSTSNDDHAVEIIQSQNWQYFTERILEACQSNKIGDNIVHSNVKEFKIIKNSVENITICKQFYEHTYNEIAQYFSDMIRQLPPNGLEEIDRDVINHYYFIDLKSNMNDLES